MSVLLLTVIIIIIIITLNSHIWQCTNNTESANVEVHISGEVTLYISQIVNTEQLK
jgi:hypothetical protein